MSSPTKIYALDALKFDNRFINELAADPEPDNYRRQVYEACYSLVRPTTVKQPKLVAYSLEMAEQLDLTTAICESEDFSQVFTGNRLTPGMQPYACCYGGHQFGQWKPTELSRGMVSQSCIVEP